MFIAVSIYASIKMFLFVVYHLVSIKYVPHWRDTIRLNLLELAATQATVIV